MQANEIFTTFVLQNLKFSFYFQLSFVLKANVSIFFNRKILIFVHLALISPPLETKPIYKTLQSLIYNRLRSSNQSVSPKDNNLSISTCKSPTYSLVPLSILPLPIPRPLWNELSFFLKNDTINVH